MIGRMIRFGVALGALMAFSHTALAQSYDDDTSDESSSADSEQTGDDDGIESDLPSSQPSPEEVEALQQYDTSECLPSCEPGFECVQGKCESMCNPPCGASEVCTGLGQCERLGVVKEHMDEADDRRTAYKRERSLVGIRAIGGVVTGLGVSLHAVEDANGDLMDPNTYFALYGALKGGVMVEIVELSAEYSPKLYKPMMFGSGGLPGHGEYMQSLLGNIGVHIPMAERVYWPIRVGGGFTVYDGNFDFQGRFDPFNVSIKTKYFLFEASLPSIRYNSNFESFHRWTGLLTLGASYITP